MQTNIVKTTSPVKGGAREIFDVESGEMKLKVYIKSKLKVYNVVLSGKLTIEREEFCATRLTFSVVKDSLISFDQGDAVSVKYGDTGLFFGYVFSKERNKSGLIDVVCYDQLRYLKNRRTYTRGQQRLDEVVNKIVADNLLRAGSIAKTECLLPSVAADNVSLLDVVKKACTDTKRLCGKRYILYDDCGYLVLKDEDEMRVDVLIDSSAGEDFVYSDTIDSNVYNQIELYSDTPRLNQRTLTVVNDKETMDKWGTLILSQKALSDENVYNQAKNLLSEYNRINREIKITHVMGNEGYIPGAKVWIRLVMGELNIDRFVRIKKAVHIFEKNVYVTDLYLDGSEFE